MKRRTFFKASSTLAVAGLFGSTFSHALARPLAAIPHGSKYKDTIGLQLWTVRNQLEEDKNKTLQAVADAGYKQVELMDTTTAADLIPLCKDLGMNVTSSFINWASICTPGAEGIPSLDLILEDATKTGLRHLVFGYIGKEHRKTADDFKRHAETVNGFGEKCIAAGIKLCYHNHSFEFGKIQGQDKTGFDLFMEHFENDKCQFELDVFWVKVGGWNPFETMIKLDGRISQVHLKDLKKDTAICYDETAVPRDAFKELGNGTIDMAAIMNLAEKIGVEQCHVEQDQSPDPIASIGESMQHLGTL